MNITTFREKVLSLKLNDVEIKRIVNLSSRHYKFLTFKFCQTKDVNEDNFKNIWHKLNEVLAEEDKFHRMQTHCMRHSRNRFVDYSDLAYNGCTDDF